ncbi:hypothetical protein CYMTET_50594 [Cymbomonas tetramitiformis]|uniref:Pesticidal crystal protein Cry22Aa Ig-like domain-containing protein n=1 Tax=Cymbomonas tetramitiformis TaxID=36881 RepID=A0AAE0EUL4_9CHLO|nr:hypothetical protein CYMTET_50594 [Cymbomonas tetramitiformis]
MAYSTEGTVTFPDLDIAQFDNMTFSTEFHNAFEDQLNAAASVSVFDSTMVEVVSIIASSVDVHFFMWFYSSHHSDNEVDTYIATLNAEPESMFVRSDFQGYGTLTADVQPKIGMPHVTDKEPPAEESRSAEEIWEGPTPILLFGEATLEVPQYSVYTDLGAASDDISDGCLVVTVDQSAVSTLEPTLPGQPHVVYFSASDSDGNTVEAFRKVIVVPACDAPSYLCLELNMCATCITLESGVPDCLCMPGQEQCEAFIEPFVPLIDVRNPTISFTDNIPYSMTSTTALARVYTVEKNTPWVEPGFHIWDETDHDKLLHHLRTFGAAAVDTSVVTPPDEPYIITYDVFDNAGNAAITKVREVHVVDSCGEEEWMCPGGGCSRGQLCENLSTSERDRVMIAHVAQDTQDHEAPRIRLVGPEEVVLEQNTLYGPCDTGVCSVYRLCDWGVKAHDALDGDLTGLVTACAPNASVESLYMYDDVGLGKCGIDTAVPGQYNISYKARNSLGAEAQTVRRITVQAECEPWERLCDSMLTCSERTVCVQDLDLHFESYMPPPESPSTSLELSSSGTVQGELAYVRQGQEYPACQPSQIPTDALPCEPGAVAYAADGRNLTRNVYSCPPAACYHELNACVGHEFASKGTQGCFDPNAEIGSLTDIWFVVYDDSYAQLVRTEVARKVAIRGPKCQDPAKYECGANCGTGNCSEIECWVLEILNLVFNPETPQPNQTVADVADVESPEDLTEMEALLNELAAVRAKNAGIGLDLEVAEDLIAGSPESTGHQALSEGALAMWKGAPALRRLLSASQAQATGLTGEAEHVVAFSSAQGQASNNQDEAEESRIDWSRVMGPSMNLATEELGTAWQQVQSMARDSVTEMLGFTQLGTRLHYHVVGQESIGAGEVFQPPSAGRCLTIVGTRPPSKMLMEAVHADTCRGHCLADMYCSGYAHKPDPQAKFPSKLEGTPMSALKLGGCEIYTTAGTEDEGPPSPMTAAATGTFQWFGFNETDADWACHPGRLPPNKLLSGFVSSILASLPGSWYSEMENGPQLRHMLTPRYRLLHGLRVRVDRREKHASHSCSERFGFLRAPCLSKSVDSSRYGSDPKFSISSNMYDFRLDEADFYNTSEGSADVSSTNKKPYAFYPRLRPEDDGFAPVAEMIVDAGVTWDRAAEVVQYMFEGGIVDEQVRRIDVETVVWNSEAQACHHFCSPLLTPPPCASRHTPKGGVLTSDSASSDAVMGAHAPRRLLLGALVPPFHAHALSACAAWHGLLLPAAGCWNNTRVNAAPPGNCPAAISGMVTPQRV